LRFSVILLISCFAFFQYFRKWSDAYVDLSEKRYPASHIVLVGADAGSVPELRKGLAVLRKFHNVWKTLNKGSNDIYADRFGALFLNDIFAEKPP